MLVVAFVIAGCGDNDDNNADRWIGVWEVEIEHSYLGEAFSKFEVTDFNFIFVNNGSCFMEVSLEQSTVTQTLRAAIRFKGTYVVDGQRYSLAFESVDVEITPEAHFELYGYDVSALEEETKSAFRFFRESGTWSLEDSAMTLVPDNEGVRVLRKL